MRRHTTWVAGALLLALPACSHKPAAQSAGMEAPSGLVDRDWVVVGLLQDTAPRGSGNLALTLRFDKKSGRVAGFSGCNRFSARYTLGPDALTIGPALATRMSCGGADTLEDRFLATLSSLTSYQLSDTALVLIGQGGSAVRLHHR